MTSRQVEMVLDSPIGPITVRFEGEAVAAIELNRAPASAQRGWSLPAVARRLQGDLQAYFGGQRVSFARYAIALSVIPPFHRKVLEIVRKIPYGQRRTYGEVARLAGRPGGARAVGQAMARNPVPIIIPCHRVVATGGKLGGFSAGLGIKRQLLALETGVAAEATR